MHVIVGPRNAALIPSVMNDCFALPLVASVAYEVTFVIHLVARREYSTV